MELAPYIHDLLLEHNCVIVPNFGGFVANNESAQIHPIRHSFAPPSKKVMFNINLTVNDGLLCNHIALVNGLSYEAAVKKVTETVATWNAKLENKELFILEKVGSLTLDTNKIIQFTQDTAENLRLDSYGLGTFQALPIKRENTRLFTQKPIDRKLSTPNEAEKKINFKKIATYSSLAIVLFLAILIPSKLDLGNIDYASLNPFQSSVLPSYQEKEYKVTFEQVVIPEITPIETLLEDETIKTTSKVPISSIIEANEMSSSKFRFFIVAGCFAELKNAEKHVKNLKAKGFDSFIIDQNNQGLYRVAFKGYMNKRIALEDLISIREEYNEAAWVLTL